MLFFCATVGMATAVESANVVGYNTVTIKGGAWNMFAVNFENISDTEGISIQDLIPGTTTGLQGGNATTGDEIQIYNPETGDYTKFYLQYVEFPIPLKVNNYKWINVTGGSVATHKFKNGDTFWYHSRGATDVPVSISGGASLSDAQTISIVTGWNMIGSAFPANFNPNTLGTEYWQASGAFGGNATTGDELQIYNPAGGDYTKYYLQNVEFPIPLKVNNWKWIAVSGGQPVETGAEVLSVGKGAWYNHKGSGFTLTIPSPMSK